METARLLTIGKIAYVMNQNDRLVSNDNFFWTLNRRVNKTKCATETSQLPGFHRIYSVYALFLFQETRKIGMFMKAK